MKTFFKENGWQVLIVGIGGFLCFQVYAMRSELSEFRGSTSERIQNIDDRLGRIEADSKAAFQSFSEKHSALSNKLTELEVKFSAFKP